MASLGKKILSAFVEMQEDEKKTVLPHQPEPVTNGAVQTVADTEKFRNHFDQLFAAANLPGPDYYEFSKMVEAMRSIPEEKARFVAAFAGLQVQGLRKEQLLATAAQYLTMLDDDARNFTATIDTALDEKVKARKKEIAEKQQRKEALKREISDLGNEIKVLSNEITASEEKIRNSSAGYEQELTLRKNSIQQNIEKIKQHIF